MPFWCSWRFESTQLGQLWPVLTQVHFFGWWSYFFWPFPGFCRLETRSAWFPVSLGTTQFDPFTSLISSFWLSLPSFLRYPQNVWFWVLVETHWLCIRFSSICGNMECSIQLTAAFLDWECFLSISLTLLAFDLWTLRRSWDGSMKEVVFW